MLPYEQQYSWGTFPVLCGDGVTRRRSAAECVVVEENDPALANQTHPDEARSRSGKTGVKPLASPVYHFED